MMKRFLQLTKLPKEIFSGYKLSWDTDGLSVANYTTLDLLSDTEIHTKDFLIYGESLKIAYLDGYLITISGPIFNVKRKQ